MKTTKLVLVILFCVAIASCGGGDGGGGGGGGGGAPTGVSATAGDGQVVINWDLVSGATSYNLYMATQSGVTKSNYSTLTGGMTHLGVTSPYVHTGLANGTTYYFIVTAVNASGESVESNQASVTPGLLPAAPANVLAAGGDGQVVINWDLVNGAASYNIYWSLSQGVTKSNGTTISNTSVPYIHIGRTNGIPYYYVVTAVNSTGESGESIQVSATPQAGATSPVTSVATYVTDTSAIYTGSLNNPNGYTTTAWFEYGTTTAYGSSTSQQAYATIGPAQISTTTTSLAASTQYHYRIVTQNGSGTYYGNDQTFTTYPSPQTIVTTASVAHELISVSASTLYFASANILVGNLWSINQTPINGGSVTSLVTGLTSGTVFASDGIDMYWAEPAGTGIGSIKKIPQNGGSATTLVSGITFVNIPTIAVDSTSVYWSGSGTMQKTDILTGATTTLVTSDASIIGVDASNVYFHDFTLPTTNVKKVGLNGGLVTTLATVDINCSCGPFATDATSIYYFNQQGYTWTAHKISKNDGSASILASGLIFGPGINDDIVVDGSNLYWLGMGTSGVPGYISINKVSTSGGAITTLTSEQKAFGSSLLVDATSTYWAAWDNILQVGTIEKMPK